MKSLWYGRKVVNCFPPEENSTHRVQSKWEAVIVKYSTNSIGLKTRLAQRYSPNGEVAASRAFTCRIKIIKPTDSIWKIALLYGNEWPHWKQEPEYDFTNASSEWLASSWSLGWGLTPISKQLRQKLVPRLQRSLSSGSVTRHYSPQLGVIVGRPSIRNR